MCECVCVAVVMGVAAVLGLVWTDYLVFAEYLSPLKSGGLAVGKERSSQRVRQVAPQVSAASHVRRLGYASLIPLSNLLAQCRRSCYSMQRRRAYPSSSLLTRPILSPKATTVRCPSTPRQYHDMCDNHRNCADDIEARNKEGDSAFVHAATLPAGMQIETAPASFFTDMALGPTGRFGSYSAPQITGVKGGKLGGAPSARLSTSTRFFDVSFDTMTQSGFEAPRRGVIAALQPTDSMDVLMLVCTVSAAKWKKGGEADVRRTAESFRITRTRPSRLQRASENDYRYRARSLKGFSEGESEIEAALARDLSTQSGSLGGKFGAAAVTQGYQYQNARGN
jgi:hypothetical protein